MLRIRRRRLTNRSSKKLESLTIDAMAHRDEIDHRIASSNRSAGEHSEIAFCCVDRPNPERQSVPGGCVISQVVRPTEPRQTYHDGLCIDGQCCVISKLFLKQIYGKTTIRVREIHDLSFLIGKLPRKIQERYHI